jgi:hypothetical protein
MAHVADAQAQEIAGAQLAINAKIKQREFPKPALHLEAKPDGPDFPQFEGRLLADRLALVPRVVMMTRVDSSVISIRLKEIPLCAARRGRRSS